MENYDNNSAGQLSTQHPSHRVWAKSLFAKNQFLAFILLFGLLGMLLTRFIFAATTNVVYSGTLTTVAPRANYSITTGSGKLTTKLTAKSKDLTLTIRNKAGNTVANINNNRLRSVTASVDVAPDTYTITVSYSGTLNVNKRFSLNLAYPLEDTSNPTAIITSPLDQATVRGIVDFAGNATDDTAITKVEFFIGTTLLATDTTSPYSSAWDTTTSVNGSVNLIIKSYDTANNIGTASGMVTVANTITTPPAPTTCPIGQTGTPPNCTVSSSYLPETEGYPRTTAQILALTQIIEAPSDRSEGKFRTNCTFSHNAWVDPIVTPGTNSSHLHSFFGNTSVNKSSTWQSLRQGTSSTCAGGVLNNSAYWYPAMLDSNEKVRAFKHASVYYQCIPTTSNEVASCAETLDMPKGMRFVAGYDMAGTAAANTENQRHLFWRCIDTFGTERAGTNGPTMPVCNIGEDLYVRFSAPECWNGVNTDSVNHRSHIAYATYVGNAYAECPAGYPKKIPSVLLQLSWEVTGTDTSNWRLSSDRMAGMTHANGQTWHADWFGAWEPTVMTSFMSNCVRAHIACNFDTTGPILGIDANSRRLVSPPEYTGPKILDQSAL